MPRESGPDEVIVSIENILYCNSNKRSLSLNSIKVTDFGPDFHLSFSGPLKYHTTVNVCTDNIAPATKRSLGLNAFQTTDFGRAFTSLPFAPLYYNIHITVNTYTIALVLFH